MATGSDIERMMIIHVHYMLHASRGKCILINTVIKEQVDAVIHKTTKN